MTKLSLDSVVARRADVLAAPVDGELVALDPQRSVYFGVERVGRRIWELIEQPMSVAAVCSILGEEFDVPADVCQSDTLAFLAEMERERLVELR